MKANWIQITISLPELHFDVNQEALNDNFFF